MTSVVRSAYTLIIWFFLLFETTGCSLFSQLADPLPPIQYSVSWRSDDKAIAVGGQGLQILDTSSNSFVLKNDNSELNNVRWVTWQPDSSQILGVNKLGQAFIWNVATGEYQPSFESQRGITAALWSPDGTRIAVSSADKIVIYDANTFETILTLKDTDEVRSIDWSPVGDKLVSGSNNGRLIIWDIQSGNILSNFLDSTSHIYSVAWSPDGKEIAAGGSSSEVLIWDVATREIVSKRSHSQNADVMQLAWNHDGTRIAIAIADTVTIWNLTGNQPLLVLDNGDGTVYTVAWSYNDNRVASVGADAIFRIWNSVNGDIITSQRL